MGMHIDIHDTTYTEKFVLFYKVFGKKKRNVNLKKKKRKE